MTDTTSDLQSSTSYRSFMTEAHRRFHDRIVADLNGILPICNQGKCTAADISNNLTEQQQITDLMEKVESLCTHLSDNVTDLFSQYYRERGRFCGAAYCTTAEIKVNLVDKTLLDRSTDVRWWSKEPILTNCVSILKKTSKSLDKELEELSAYMEGSAVALRIPSASSSWSSIDVADRVAEISAYFPRKRDLMFKASVRAEFAKLLTSFSDFLAANGDHAGTIKAANKLIKLLDGCQMHVDNACRQLELVRATYPSIFDIVVTDDQGNIIANARKDRRVELLSQSVIHESWCNRVLKASTNHTQIERARLKDEEHPAIVFSNSIREPQDRHASILGTISAFCDFQTEIVALLGNYLPVNDDGTTCDGWYSFFTDERGVVICSNDASAIWPGSHSDLSRPHRQLENGETHWSHMVFKGRESFVFSACGSGNNALGSSGWISHLVAPANDIMQTQIDKPTIALGKKQLMQSKLVPEISKSTYSALQEDRKAIKLISLNGILFASQLGSRGAALAPVFDKITATGDSATNRMESLLYEMANSEIDLNVSLLKTLAKQAVDLISQKVLERSHALQLWARTTCIQNFLRNTSEQQSLEVENLLRWINDDYPVYRCILLLNSSGEIKACSRPSQLAGNDVRSVSDQVWFNNAMRGRANSSTQITETFVKLFNSDAQTSLVFAHGIPAPGDDEASIGVLASFFDWQTEAPDILRSCLPKSANGRPLPGSVAFFTNRDQIVIESTNSTLVKTNEHFALPEEHYQLNGTKAISGTFSFQDATYIIASAKCERSKNLDGMDWTAHVIRPLI